MYKSPKYDGKLRDIWSIGVIAYMLYSYQPLINSKYKEEQLRILNTSSIYQYLQIYNIDGLKWDKCFIDFLSHCLAGNPANRWEALELLHHDYLQIKETRSIFDRFIGWLSPKSKKSDKSFGFRSNNSSTISVNNNSNNNNNSNKNSNNNNNNHNNNSDKSYIGSDSSKGKNDENVYNNKCSIVVVRKD